MDITYDVVIPAYNAQNSLPDLLQAFERLENKPASIIVVDDGSTDDTRQLISRFEHIHVIPLPINEGKGKALRHGIDYFLKNGSGEYLLFMDADGQHPVESIPLFLTAAGSGYFDVIIGNRSRKIGIMPLARIFSNTVSSLLVSWVTGQSIKDSQCGFRLLRRTVVETVTLTEDGFQVETELIVKAAKRGFIFGFVPIPTIYNGEKSYIKHVSDTVRFIKIVVKEIFYS